ncbi:unnamed protein product, partial [Urochloa humidicola]
AQGPTPCLDSSLPPTDRLKSRATARTARAPARRPPRASSPSAEPRRAAEPMPARAGHQEASPRRQAPCPAPIKGSRASPSPPLRPAALRRQAAGADPRRAPPFHLFPHQRTPTTPLHLPEPPPEPPCRPCRRRSEQRSRRRPFSPPVVLRSLPSAFSSPEPSRASPRRRRLRAHADRRRRASRRGSERCPGDSGARRKPGGSAS